MMTLFFNNCAISGTCHSIIIFGVTKYFLCRMNEKTMLIRMLHLQVSKIMITYSPRPFKKIRPLNHCANLEISNLYFKYTLIFVKFSFDCNGGNWQRMLWKENSRLCTCSYCCRTKSMSPLGMSLNNVLRTIHVIRKMVQMKKRWNVCGSK